MADSLFGIPGISSLPTQDLGNSQMVNPGMPNIDMQGPFSAGGFSSGAMGGAMFNNMEDAAYRNARGSDLAYENAMNTYQQNLADNPIRQQSRDLQKQSMGEQKKLLDSGLPLDTAKSNLTTQMKQNLAKQSEAELQDTYNHYQGMIGLAEYANRTPNFLNDPEAQKQLHDMAEKQGIHSLPEKFTQKDLDHMNRVREIGINTVNYLQQSGLKTQDYTQKVGIGNAMAGKGELQVTGEYHIEALDRQIRLQAEQRLGLLPMDEQLRIKINRAAAAGETLSQSDMQQLMSVKRKEAEKNPVVMEMINSERTEMNRMDQPALAAYAAARLGADNPLVKQFAQAVASGSNQVDSLRPLLITATNKATANTYIEEEARKAAAQETAGAKFVNEQGQTVRYQTDQRGKVQEVPAQGGSQSAPTRSNTQPTQTPTQKNAPPGAVGWSRSKNAYVDKDGNVIGAGGNTTAAPVAQPVAAPTQPPVSANAVAQGLQMGRENLPEDNRKIPAPPSKYVGSQTTRRLNPDYTRWLQQGYTEEAYAKQESKFVSRQH